MSEQPERRTLSWLEAVARVLANPSIASFDMILDDPRANTYRALRWLFLPMIGGMMLFFGIIQILFGGQISLEWFANIAFIVLIGTALWTFHVAIFVLCVHLGASLLGSKGNYGELLYSIAAFLPAMFFMQMGVALLTTTEIFFLALRVYRIFLIVLAVRTVYRLSWTRTGVAIVLGVMISLYIGGSVFL